MSVQEITELRKAGKLQEAYRMAREELREEPESPWASMAMFWVLRDACRKLLEDGQTERAKPFLDMMAQLLPQMVDEKGYGEQAYAALRKRLLPEAELVEQAARLAKENAAQAYERVKHYVQCPAELDEALHESLGWVLYYYIRAGKDSLSSVEVRTALRDYLRLANPRPSLLHSMVLNHALGFAKGHADFDFYRFFLLWKPEYLRREDLRKSTEGDQEYPSLIARVCRHLATGNTPFAPGELCEKIPLPKPEALDLLREPCFWRIQDLHKAGKAREAFEALARYNQTFAGSGPSHWHSEVLNLAERCMDGPEAWRFAYFLKQWDYRNLRMQDWQERTDKEGHSYTPLALKAAKKCYEALKNAPRKDADLLLSLEGLYEAVEKHAPEDEWAVRRHAHICMWAGQHERAAAIYKRLLLDLSDKYYVWAELAACVPGDNRLRLTLLCKALQMERNEDFLGSIRLALAEVLLEENLQAEALCELDTYKKYHDKPAPRYAELAKRILPETLAPGNNKALYERHAAEAEDYAFADRETQNLVLAERWEKEGKKRCVLTDGKGTTVSVNAKRFPLLLKEPLGTVFSVKCRVETETRKTYTGPYTGNVRMTIETKRTLLCLHKADAAPWEGMPQSAGYVAYVNGEKQVAHIATPQLGLLFYGMKGTKNVWKKGDLVWLRAYRHKQEKEVRTQVVDMKKATPEAALPCFSSGIAAVDHVNPEKQLFHYVFGPGKGGGTVLYKETELRPEAGDLLKVTYCTLPGKDGDKRLVTLSAEHTSETDCEALKTVEGRLVVKYRDEGAGGMPDFAFVGDYYVHRSLLQKHGIATDCHVQATAVYAGQGKWKVVRMDRKEGGT